MLGHFDGHLGHLVGHFGSWGHDGKEEVLAIAFGQNKISFYLLKLKNWLE